MRGLKEQSRAACYVPRLKEGKALAELEHSSSPLYLEVSLADMQLLEGGCSHSLGRLSNSHSQLSLPGTTVQLPHGGGTGQGTGDPHHSVTWTEPWTLEPTTSGN